MKLLTPISNRAADGKFSLPADGFYHLVPKGEYPHPSGMVQVIDDIAVTTMVNRFNVEARTENFPGLLVDYDHFSQDQEKPSGAAGWIMQLENRADGIWGKVNWTPRAESEIKGGEYRFASPVWDVADTAKINNSKKVRPLRLDSVGLTNTPNLRGMKPLSNRQAVPAPRQGEPAELENKKTMKSVATYLGLSADASEEAVLQAVTKINNRAAEAEGKVGTLTSQNTELKKTNDGLLETQVEADLQKYSNRFKPEMKDKWKKQLLSNRAEAIELLEGMTEMASGTRTESSGGKVLNRKAAGTPGDNGGTGGDKIANRAAQANAEVVAYQNANKVDFQTAWHAVQAAKPELFTRE